MSDKPNWGELVEGERLREYAPPSVEQDPLMVAYAEGRKDEREEWLPVLEALKRAEDLLAFHEGSATPEFYGAHPTVRINGEDFAEVLAGVRAAIASVEGKS